MSPEFAGSRRPGGPRRPVRAKRAPRPMRPIKPRRQGRRYWPYLLLLLVAVTIYALPAGLERLAQAQLESKFDGRATLQRFDVNLFSGSLHLSGLLITATQQQPLLALDDLEVEIDYWALLRGDLRLAHIDLDGARVVLERSADGGWLFDGLPIVSIPGAGIALVVDVASLNNLELQLQGPDWQHELFVAQAHLSDMSTAMKGGGDLIIDGRIDGAPIRVSARLSSGGNSAHAAGRVDIDRLDLATLTDLGAAQSRSLQGTLEAGFDLSLGNGQAGAIELAGRATIDRAALRSGDQTIGAGSLEWNGKVRLKRDENWHGDLTGQLTGSALYGDGLEWSSRLDASSLSWRGDVQIGEEEGALKLRHQGSGVMGALRRDGGDARDATASILSWDGDLQFDRAASAAWLLRYDGIAGAGDVIADGIGISAADWDGSLRAEHGLNGVSGQLDGALELIATLSGPQWGVETGKMNWHGDARWSTDDAGLSISLSSDLDGEGLAYQDDATGINARVSAFTWGGGPMQITVGDLRTVLRQEVTLALGSSMVAGSDGQLVLHEGVAWDGPMVITTGPEQEFAIDARGRLTSPAGDLSLIESARTISQARLDWDGLVHYQNGGSGLAVDGGLTLIAPSLVDNRTDGTLFDAVDVSVEHLTASTADGLTAKGVVVSSPRISSTDVESRDAGVATGDRLTITDLNWSWQGALRLGEVAVDAFNARIVRDASGLQLPLPTQPKASAQTASPNSQGDWSLAALHIAPGARLTYDDRVIKGTFLANVLLERADLEGLDRRDPNAVASVELEARYGDFTTFQLSGMLQPEPGTVRAVLHGKLRDLDLTTLTPYAEAYLGYRLRYGQAEADLQLTLGADGASGRQELTLRTLSVAPLRGETAETLDEQLGMPLPDALTRLRDGHGDITLELRLGETSDGGGANLLDALIVALQPGAAPQTELVELPAQ